MLALLKTNNILFVSFNHNHDGRRVPVHTKVARTGYMQVLYGQQQHGADGFEH